jgi:hypothetical protein
LLSKRQASRQQQAGSADFYRESPDFWASRLEADFPASVFTGSTLSHFRQRSAVRPLASVIGINRLEHFGHRPSSMMASRFQENKLFEG